MKYLAVAYQYTYNGKVYQVGEFSQDVHRIQLQATSKGFVPEIIKSNFATYQPSYLGFDDEERLFRRVMEHLDRQDFKLNVLYEEPSLGAKRYLPVDDLNSGYTILSLVNLDRLNNQNDPQPDGVFDYVEGFTVISPYSRIIFPVLEPLGAILHPKVYSSAYRYGKRYFVLSLI